MVLFMVCATLAQLLVILLIILAFTLVGALIFREKGGIFLLIGAVAALPISFVVYGWAMKRLSPWLEKNVPQLFRRKR
jgi:hypothetical protein